jgi:hypothetical protein
MKTRPLDKIEYTVRSCYKCYYSMSEVDKITSVLQERRLKFIGHIWRKKDEIASQLVL